MNKSENTSTTDASNRIEESKLQQRRLNHLLVDECDQNFPSLPEVKRLLHEGADVNAMGISGRTPLISAIARRATDVARELLNQGAAINLQDLDGRSPLHCAVTHNQHGLGLELIRRGANVACKDMNGQTALHLAAFTNQAQFASMLLDQGAPIDPQDKDGSTPLHKTSNSTAIDSALVLLSRGASLEIMNHQNKMPLMMAAEWHQHELGLLLIAYGADGSMLKSEELKGLPAMNAAAQAGLTQRALELIHAGADPLARHRNKNAFEEAEAVNQLETLAALQAWLAGRAIDDVIAAESAKKRPAP